MQQTHPGATRKAIGMLRQSSLVSLRALCGLLAFSMVLTLTLASAAFAQLITLPTLNIDDVTFTEGDTGTSNVAGNALAAHKMWKFRLR
jgi:hypothetical protein